MSEIDQQFVEYVVKSIVGNPDKVEVKRSVDERGVLLELSVDPDDLGRVIGKRGATAQSLRTLLRALGTKNEARYNLKIVDTGPPPAKKADDAGASASDDPVAPASDDDAAATDAESINEEDEEKIVEQAPAPEDEDDDQNDLASKTRRELAELDDLDV